MTGPVVACADDHARGWWGLGQAQVGNLCLAKRRGAFADNGAVLRILQGQRDAVVGRMGRGGRFGHGLATNSHPQNGGGEASCFDRFDGAILSKA